MLWLLGLGWWFGFCSGAMFGYCGCKFWGVVVLVWVFVRRVGVLLCFVVLLFCGCWLGFAVWFGLLVGWFIWFCWFPLVGMLLLG